MPNILIAVPAERAGALRRALIEGGSPAAQVGRVEAGEGLVVA